MKLIFKYLIFFLFSGRLASQDVHFSQYYFSPLSLNPANTGNYKGDYRFFANYRSQWRTVDKGYNTYSAGGDVNLFPKNINIGAGLMLISDLSASNLSVTKIMPSIAGHYKIAGFKLHAGIQPGVVIKRIDFYRYSFQNQLNWNTGAFDNSMTNIEPKVGQHFVYFDLNAGASISKKIGIFEPVIGVAFFHLNGPTESFFDDKKNKLPVRQAFNLELNFNLTANTNLKLHSLYGTTTKAEDWVSGVIYEYVLSRTAFFSNSVFGGFMWRDGFKTNFDAGIMTLGMNLSHYTIGFSYDVTQSKFKTSVDSRGAYEIALIYRAKSTRLSKKEIPCDRF